MHLRFAPKLGDAFPERSTVGSDRLPQSVVGVEDCSKAKRQNGAGPEAHADHSGMFDDMLFFQLTIFGCAVVFGDDDRKITAGIAENGGAIYALNAVHQERTAASGAIL